MAINRVQPGDNITAEGYNQLVDAANANATFESPDFNFVDSSKGKTFSKRNRSKLNKLEVPRPFDCRLTCNASNEVFFQIFDPIQHTYLFGEMPDQNFWFIWDGTKGKRIEIPDDYHYSKWLTLSGGTTDEWSGVQLLALSCTSEGEEFLAGCMFADLAYRDIERTITCEGVGKCKIINPEPIICSYKFQTKNPIDGESNSFRIINCGSGEMHYGSGAKLSGDDIPVPDAAANTNQNFQLSSIDYPSIGKDNDGRPIFSLFDFEKKDNQIQISSIIRSGVTSRGDFLYRNHSDLGNVAENLAYVKFNDVYTIPDTSLSAILPKPQNSIEDRVVNGLRMRQIFDFDDHRSFNEVSAAQEDYLSAQHLLFRGIEQNGAAEVNYIDLSAVAAVPDADIKDTDHKSIQHRIDDGALELYHFDQDVNIDYFDKESNTGYGDIVLRYTREEDDPVEVDYVSLKDIAHFADNESPLDEDVTGISSTEVFITPNTHERIIRIHGFADLDNSKEKSDFDSKQQVDLLVRAKDSNGTDVEYVKLSSIIHPTDTERTDITQSSVEEKEVEGKTQRQLKSFDDISDDKEEFKDISANSTVLIRKDTEDGKLLKYVDVSAMSPLGDSQSSVGLSSIERDDNHYSLFGFGTNGPVTQVINLSSATLSTDVVTRSDNSGLRHIEYTKLSVQYPDGDAEHLVPGTMAIGAIEGPLKYSHDSTGAHKETPKGTYTLNGWFNDLNDITKEDALAAPSKVLIKHKAALGGTNLRYLDLSALSSDCCADSDVPATAWGDRSQESLDKIPTWHSLVGKDYHNIYQLHNFNNPPFVNPSDLASSKPTVLVRSEYGAGVGKFIELKYVPLSTLSSLPMDSEITRINQKSLETKHENGENWNQLYKFDSPETLTAKEDIDASLVPVRVSSGNGATLKYAPALSIGGGGSAPIISTQIEVITDIAFEFDSNSGVLNAKLTKKKVNVLSSGVATQADKTVQQYYLDPGAYDIQYSTTDHKCTYYQSDRWVIRKTTPQLKTAFTATPHQRAI